MKKQEYDFFFPPYVGDKYADAGNFFNGKKVLVIGNSHHCDTMYDKEKRCGCQCKNYNKTCNNFTIDVIKSYKENPQGTGLRKEDGDKNWRRTFTRFANVFKDACDVNAFYDSIVFYNFLQRAVCNSKAQGSPEEISESKRLFRTLMSLYNPDYIIVWGIPNVLRNLPKGETWNQVDKEGRVYKFKSEDKNHIIIGIDHPVSTHQTKEQRLELIKAYAPELIN